MLIDFRQCLSFLADFHIQVKGILHIGAHTCEEKEAYNRYGIPDANIYWVDGNNELVEQQKMRGIPNIYHALIDKEEKEMVFNVTNNMASSSILELGTHLDHYKNIFYVGEILQKTKRIDTLAREQNIPIQHLNFWNLDIQGNELSALKSGEQFLPFVDAIYCEVNYEYVYKNCPLIQDIDAYLLLHGFIRLETHIAEHCGWGDALYVRVSKRNST